jgi:hypothetical protein
MIKSTLLAAALAIGMVSSASAVTVFNGDFEDTSSSVPGNGLANNNTLPSLAGGTGNRSWDVFTEIPGWTTLGGSGIEVQTNNTLRTIDAHSGKHYIELDSHPNNISGLTNSSMKQVIYLAAGLYKLSFWYSPRESNPDTNGIGYGIVGVLDVITGPGFGTNVGAWTLVEKLFDVDTAGDQTLFFFASGKADQLGGLVDTVSISAVPLPPTAILLGSAFVGAAFLRRRRSAKTA